MKRFLIILTTVLITLILAAAGWVIYSAVRDQQNNTPAPSITTFEECANAGYPIMESYPRQCRTPEGTNFTETITESPAETKVFTSGKGVEVIIYDWQDDKEVSSPLTIRGKVPGTWSFEASFPVSLLAGEDTLLVQTPAQIDGEWMTEANVPFSVTLNFETPEDETEGRIIFRKDNPSGLPENDDVVEIPIRF